MRFLKIFLLFIAVSYADKAVKYAAVIYRHGDRTPVEPYPNDPWKSESYWPVKFGQLTSTGVRQHYALGQWLRKRYSSLISEQFDPNEIYIQSTDVDRTLMSAQANLAGMFPPTGKSVWNINLLWQPIPVHTKPEKDDEILAMKKNCIEYDSEKDEYFQSKAYKDGLLKLKSLMDDMTKWTGKQIKDYEDIADIYSTLYIESLYNYSLPDWTTSIYPDKLREPACYSFTIATATPLMARLKAGPLLKQILDQMVKVMSNKPDAHKLSIYSGHDFTIGNILSAMGLYDGSCPAYTSTIFIELLQDNDNADYFVRLSYRNSTAIVEPFILNIPHCGKLCAISKYTQLYENLLSVDFDFECDTTNMVIYMLGLIFSLCMLIYVVYKSNTMKKPKTRRGRRGRQHNYFHVPIKFEPTVAI